MGREELYGITIGGIPLDDHLEQEYGEETLEALRTKRHIKRKARVKYMDTKEKSSEVTHTPQSELNRMNIDSNIQKARSNIERTIVVLLTGTTIDSSYLKTTFNASDGSAILNKLYKSLLGEYIRKEQDGRKYMFTMSAKGCMLTPEEAIAMYLRGFTVSSTPKIADQVPEEPSPVLQPPAQTININITFRIKWGD